MSSQSRRQKFEVGDCVETSKGEKCIIRFIGKVNGLCHNNVLYGIEYIDGTIGEHNGKYKGKKYFIGLPKRCSFIKYDEIRRKTKYYTTNSPKFHSKKSSNSVKNKSKSIRSIHSNNMFTQDYIYKSNTPKNRKQSKHNKPTLNSKRKSLPTKLNEFNGKKNLKNRNKNTLNLNRRSSASNKNKNKYLLHLDELKNSSNNSHSNHKKKQKRIRNSTTNMFNNKKINKYNNKIRTTSMHNALKTDTKIKVTKCDKSIQKQKQKRRNANPHLETKQCKKRYKKYTNNIEECSRYKHERIHFSQMDKLEFGNMNLENILSYDSIEEKEYKTKTPKSERKNAFSNIILSQDSLNEYHLKRNLVIGDIFIGNKYLLKNGKYGICLYVGPVHWIDNGKMTVENEYIGIALLEKDSGRHDGEYKGKRYFQCASRCGIFVKRNKLWKDCGPVSQEEIDKITRQRRKRGGLLYDEESDISDLSDDMNHDIYSDSDYTHSGHSDFEDNNSLNIDDIDDINDDIVSYIDLFSAPIVDNIDNDNIIITPVQYVSDNEKELDLKIHKKVKIKTKKKSKTRQSRSVSADQSKRPSINTLKSNKKSMSRTVKNKSKKTKSCKALQTKMEKFGFKNGKYKCKDKKWQSQTLRIGKNDKKESKTKRKKRGNTFENNNELNEMPNVQKLIMKSNGNKLINNIKSTQFPFVHRNSIEIEINDTLNDIIEYKPVATKKRSRRNATPIVSIPSLIGTNNSNFISLLNEDVR